ncbi:hypothetical protein [Paenibacillus sp. TC-CSREp1]|uniref:hypothetical protein n=1 Tax=Paenibacillus sp. TC-CSREp1 TaxID=3410089 RepID=UPI003CECB404
MMNLTYATKVVEQTGKFTNALDLLFKTHELVWEDGVSFATFQMLVDRENRKMQMALQECEELSAPRGLKAGHLRCSRSLKQVYDQLQQQISIYREGNVPDGNDIACRIQSEFETVTAHTENAIRKAERAISILVTKGASQ